MPFHQWPYCHRWESNIAKNTALWKLCGDVKDTYKDILPLLQSFISEAGLPKTILDVERKDWTKGMHCSGGKLILQHKNTKTKILKSI